MDVCIILCLTFGAQNIPMCFRLPADNNSLGWLTLWNLKTTICQRFCITFQLHNMGRDLQTLKRVSWKTIYIYIYINSTFQYFAWCLHMFFRYAGQAKTKAAVASTHGLQLDNAQQLHAFLEQHHSEVTSEQHERLHEVRKWLILQL